MKKLIISLLLILMVIALVVGVDVYRKVIKPYKGYAGSIRILIEKGSSVSTIGKLLYQKKVIPSYTYFSIYYRLFFTSIKLKSGEYRFDEALTMKQIIEKLNRGKVILYKITIKEGMTVNETADFLESNHHIDSRDFLNACRENTRISDVDSKATDLEGYLFPDTYLVPHQTGAEDLVSLMVGKFKSSFTHTMAWRAMDIKFSIRDVVILASLIEKETSSRDERFLISSVFHNRLRLGMPLACDPTIVYILKKENRYTGKLRWNDLKIKSRFNTRLYKGLPPGPICSPGIASIEAALYPEQTKYLYFVAKDLKTHYFSKTLKEHNWAVRKYIINRERFK
jgi:UPF0755 protein